ncbi:MAG: hypothetical protein NTV15_03565 [Candidatus Bathyarchaeota archaeon]|nr:hypothetical protein [Candidatus Bathyarchaeota archaeon]
MTAQENKLKGAVREIGLTHDIDHNNSFTVTINIQIKTEGRVSYEEAEKLASRYRREYLGKEVEFLAVNLPCPVCSRILNSEVGLKKHILMSHPERVDLIAVPKAEKDTKTKVVKNSSTKTEAVKKRISSNTKTKKNANVSVKTVKALSEASKTKKKTPLKKVKIEAKPKTKPKTTNLKPIEIEPSKPISKVKNGGKLKIIKTDPVLETSSKPLNKETLKIKQSKKSKQLKLF